MPTYRSRKKVRRKRSRKNQDHEGINSIAIPLQQDHNSYQSEILDMQGVVGNQAVLQMLGQGEVEQPTAKPTTFDAGAFKIQRMPTVEDAEAYIFDSDRRDNQELKKSIVNMLKQYYGIIDSYADGFPSTADEARNSADKYFADNVKQLTTLIKGVDTVSKRLKDNIQGRMGKKKFGKKKHQNRLDQLNAFRNQGGGIHANDAKWTLNEIHHQCFSAVMAGASDLSFITTDDIVGDVNEGAAKGGVHELGKGQVNTKQGVKTGYFKSDEASPDDAGLGISIGGHEGKQSLRAVATYQVSELLGMGIIPYTALTKGEDEEGNVTTGQFMEEAEGFTGRGNILSDELPDGQADEVRRLVEALKNPDLDSDEKQQIGFEIEGIVGMIGHKEIDGKIYKLKHAAADIDWMSPVIQKDLSTLQLFDMIAGHADRHAENYIVETDDMGRKTGVKGIDNDSVWGEKIGTEMLTKGGTFDYKRYMKTPGLPPVVDAEVAYRVVSTPWKAVEGVLAHYTLRPEEIQAAQERWEYVQEGIKSMIVGNRLATSGLGEADQIFLLMDLYGAIGEELPQDLMDRRMMLWGDETAELMENDSYVERITQAYDQKVNPEDFV